MNIYDFMGKTTKQIYNGQITPKQTYNSQGGLQSQNISPYAKQMTDTFNKIQNRPAFSYDIGNDAVAQNSIKNAVNSVSRIAAGKNMLYSESNKNHMNQAALNEGQRFQDSAYQRYQQEGNDMYNQLQALQGFDSTAYARNRDTIADQQEERNRQDQIYQQLGYLNPYAGQQANPVTNQYAGNYQAEINRRRATADPNDDALIADLQAAQANKVFSDPQLLAKYGQQLGYMTQNARQQQSDNAYRDKQYADSRADTKFNQDMALNEFGFNSNLQNKKLALDERQTNASIANMAADNARQGAKSQADGQYMKYMDYIKTGQSMKNLIDKDTLGSTRRYSDDQIRQWVLGLPLDENDQLRLIYDLGVMPQAIESTRPQEKPFTDFKKMFED